MTKIKINYFKLYFFIVVISIVDLVFTNSLWSDKNESFIFIQASLTLICIVSYLKHKMSSTGLYINKDGFIWRLNNKQFKYPWSTAEIKVLFSFMSFTLFEIRHTFSRISKFWFKNLALLFTIPTIVIVFIIVITNFTITTI